MVKSARSLFLTRFYQLFYLTYIYSKINESIYWYGVFIMSQNSVMHVKREVNIYSYVTCFYHACMVYMRHIKSLNKIQN